MPLVERDDEQRLITRARTGGECAFEQLAERYAAPIYRVALRMLGNGEDAEDLRQETFIRAFTRLRSFRGESSLGTWLYAIAVKLCLSHRRARRPVSMEELPDLAGATADPEHQLCRREERDRVQRALAALAPPDRLLIILKHLEGLSHEEIAQVLHCSAESSRSRLNRARKLFRERFHQETVDGTM